jgi:EmrB/QacA subfamily drug resistance transporter
VQELAPGGGPISPPSRGVAAQAMARPTAPPSGATASSDSPTAGPPADPPLPPDGDAPLDRQVWWVASVVVIGSIMSIMATTIVNVALDRLSEELRSPLADIQWVVTGYLLGMAAVIPAAGWAVRRVGGKRLYLSSLVAFSGASVLCALAWSAESLIAFRVLQGMAGGITLPVGQMMLARAAGPQRMGRVMSVIGVPMVLGPVFGPVLGGFIVEHLSWHWIFVVNVPFGLVALALGSRCLPVRPRVPAGPLDVPGLLLCCAGVPLIVFGLSKTTGAGGFGAATVLVPLALGLGCLAAFARHARRSDHPLLDIRLLGNDGFAAAVVGVFCVGAVLFGAMLLLPLYFQTVRGEDALHAGLLLIPQGLGAATAMPFAGRLADRIGGGQVAVVGLTLLVLTTVPLALISDTTSYWAIGAALYGRGVAMGASMMPMFAGAYATVRTSDIAHATPQLNVAQRVGGSLGTAVLTVVLTHQIIAAFPAAQGASSTLPRGGEGPPPAAVAGPLADAFATTYWWAVAITALAIVPAVVLARIERRSRLALRRERAGLAELV